VISYNLSGGIATLPPLNVTPSVEQQRRIFEEMPRQSPQAGLPSITLSSFGWGRQVLIWGHPVGPVWDRRAGIHAAIQSVPGAIARPPGRRFVASERGRVGQIDHACL
jgi:hypothetical protein